MDPTQVIATALGAVASVIIAIVGATWFLATRLASLEEHIRRVEERLQELALRLTAVEHRLTRVEQQLDALQSAAWMQGQVQGIFAGSLQRLGGLTPEDVTELTQRTSAGLGGPVAAAIGRAARGNPITLEEADRLRGYIAKVQSGERLSPDEARDLFDLSNEVVRELPTDPGAWQLATVAAFLYGLYRTGKHQEPAKS